MNTIGLDVSPLRIGWAYYEDTTLTNHGVILFETDEWVTPGMRAAAIEDTIKHDTVHGIGMEAVFVGPNKLGSIRAAMALGQVESICDYLWPDARQKILTATQWRSACGIQQGGKQPVWEWAIKRTMDDGTHAPLNQDAADAIAIGHAAHLWFANNA